MNIRERVNAVLAAWCGADPNSIDSTMTLEDLWISTRDSTINPHSAIPFADGVEDLRRMLNNEFKKPGPVRKDTSGLKRASFKASDMNTVGLLVKAVVACPNLLSKAAGGTV